MARWDGALDRDVCSDSVLSPNLAKGDFSHIPSDLVVDYWTSDGESRSYRDVLLLPDV